MAVPVIARFYHVPAAIRAASPVAVTPESPMATFVPGAIHPLIARTGARGRIRNHRWRRVSVAADADSNREVRFGEQRTSREQHTNQQFRFHFCNSSTTSK